MNLRAMVIIMANSWAGNLMALRGLRRLSIPSVRAIGEVVRVKRDVPETRKISLRAIKIPCLKPSRVNTKNPSLHITVPLEVKKTFKKKVSNIIKRRGLIPFTTYLTGMSETATIAAKNKNTKP